MGFDVIVLGGGPSGLSVAMTLIQEGYRVAIIETGEHIYNRDRENPFDVANGIGGAGLFSDGKLSFYPAASNVWRLDSDLLRESYSHFGDLMINEGIQIPVFDDNWLCGNIEVKDGRKYYSSMVLDFPGRLNLVYRMCDIIGRDNLFLNKEVIGINKRGAYYFVAVKDRHNSSAIHNFTSLAIVIASGKHAFKILEPKTNGIKWHKKFEKYEIGVRIESPSKDFDFYLDEQRDVKIIDSLNSGVQVRTFCCCRDGEVVNSTSGALCGINGESLSEPNSCKTNIGVHLRVTNEKSQICKDICRLLDYPSSPHHIPLHVFIRGDVQLFNETIDNYLLTFITQHFPKMSQSMGATLYFPSYECDGYYPDLDDKLKVKDENIWMAGDATGKFRGLTAAFISGFIVGRDIIQKLESYSVGINSKLKIKHSNTDKLSLVFTAQSKQYFYCRDAVCAFVMRQRAVPVNPFRVFGYFLDDRVSRDIVRNGNNELISRCDELWVFGPVADGVLFEIARCIKLGIPIRFFTISSVVSEITEISIDDIVFEPEVHAKQIKREDLLNFLRNVTSGPQQLDLFEGHKDE